MHELLHEVFMPAFSNRVLEIQGDAAVLGGSAQELAFTTDSYVVDPLFFPGGDIGKLAVCGTLNDLAVVGANPMYMSVAFILEEGFLISDLKRIVNSMALEANRAGVKIVTGDTKVVPKGKADKIFINTSGIGFIQPSCLHLCKAGRIRVGDKVLVNGTIGDHAVAVMAAREGLGLQTPVVSDCACLAGLIQSVLHQADSIHVMRDLTRGGLATALVELVRNKHFGVSLFEENIPIMDPVMAYCDLLGIDPLHLANEGKLVLFVDRMVAPELLQLIRQHPLGKNAAEIGEVTDEYQAEIVLHTSIGGRRSVLSLPGEQLPRIC